MAIVITGVAGFIGSHLVEELVRQKNKVVVLDNLSTGNLNNLKLVKKKIKFLKYDISKKKNILKKLKGIKYVFNLAGLSNTIESTRNPKKYYITNVDGTYDGTVYILGNNINFHSNITKHINDIKDTKDVCLEIIESL